MITDAFNGLRALGTSAFEALLLPGQLILAGFTDVAPEVLASVGITTENGGLLYATTALFWLLVVFIARTGIDVANNLRFRYIRYKEAICFRLSIEWRFFRQRLERIAGYISGKRVEPIVEPPTVYFDKLDILVLEFAAPGELWVGCHLPGHWDSGMAATFDRDLAISDRLEIEIVPTLLERRDGQTQATAQGWNREQWETITGVGELGPDLPAARPGCGSISWPPSARKGFSSSPPGRDARPPRVPPNAGGRSIDRNVLPVTLSTATRRCAPCCRKTPT